MNAARLRMEATTRPRERLSEFLAGQYPLTGREKLLACDLKCSPRAARNLLAGHWPADDRMDDLVERFGSALIDAVFGPTLDATQARLRAERLRLAAELDAVNRRLEHDGPLAGPLARRRIRTTVAGRRQPPRTTARRKPRGARPL